MIKCCSWWNIPFCQLLGKKFKKTPNKYFWSPPSSAPEYKYAASRCIEKLLHSFTLSRTHSLHGPSFTPHSPSTSWCWRAAFQECTAYHLGLGVIRRWWKMRCCCASLQECTADHKSPKWLIFPLGLACRTPSGFSQAPWITSFLGMSGPHRNPLKLFLIISICFFWWLLKWVCLIESSLHCMCLPFQNV